MKFLVKCGCGNIDVHNDPNKISGCSVCKKTDTLFPACAGCGESIEKCDVKECNGWIVHDNTYCRDSIMNRMDKVDTPGIETGDSKLDKVLMEYNDFRKQAESGTADAQYKLYLFMSTYIKSLKKLQANKIININNGDIYEETRKWLNRAHRQGHKEAVKTIKSEQTKRYNITPRERGKTDTTSTSSDNSFNSVYERMLGKKPVSSANSMPAINVNKLFDTMSDNIRRGKY